MARTLVEVDFYVCCNHDVNLIIAAIKKRFNNIVDIHSTSPIPGGDPIDVCGIAQIDPTKIKEFENDLKTLKIDSTNRHEITKVSVRLPRDYVE